jgi:hypothetical protein
VGTNYNYSKDIGQNFNFFFFFFWFRMLNPAGQHLLLSNWNICPMSCPLGVLLAFTRQPIKVGRLASGTTFF